MKPIFSRGPSLQIRLILAVLVALGIIIADSRLGTFSQIRTYMDRPPSVLSTLFPMLLVNCWMAYRRRWPRVTQLELENRALRQELLLKNSEPADAWTIQTGERASCASCWVPRCVRMSRKW